MPNVKSAAKRLRQSQKARIRNRADRSTLRTAIKKLRSALEEENLDAARTQLPETISIIDRTAKKGVIHANNAARNASRLTLAVETLARKQSGDEASAEA